MKFNKILLFIALFGLLQIVSCGDRAKEDALIFYIKKNDLKNIKDLINFNSEDISDATINRSFILSFSNGNLEIVKYLIESRPNIDINLKDNEGRSALYWAVLNKSPKMLDYLISHRAEVNIQDKSGGLTPLMQAASLGTPELVRKLIEAGADTGLVSKSGKTFYDYAKGDRRFKKIIRDYKDKVMGDLDRSGLNKRDVGKVVAEYVV